MTTKPLVVTASPHLRSRDSTPRIMWHVVGSLVPMIVAGMWLFGVSALLVLSAAMAKPSSPSACSAGPGRSGTAPR